MREDKLVEEIEQSSNIKEGDSDVPEVDDTVTSSEESSAIGPSWNGEGFCWSSKRVSER